MSPSTRESGPRHARCSWAPIKALVAARQTAPRWEPLERLMKTAESAFAPNRNRYEQLRRLWERRLRYLSRDFTPADWATFRPLRLSREEDWSDWLAWLLETSTTGTMAEEMLGRHLGCRSTALRTPKIRREVPTDTRERRADIIVSWRSGRQTHIEVKVGDENFDKTFDTCRLLHGSKYPQDWCDAILIPDTSKAAWDEVAEAHVHDDPVYVILWSDVVRGLRKSLWKGRESTAWQVWAWTFGGAVESQILGLQEPGLSGPGMGELDMLSRWVEVLTLGKANNYEH
jgi:hypothetical protein